jgi:hypothetical protein
MHHLNAVPDEFKGTVFERLFELGRIEILNPEEMEAYNKSLLQYADVQDIAELTELSQEQIRAISLT